MSSVQPGGQSPGQVLYTGFQLTWYASEFDGEDVFFGLVSGFEVKLGYFSLSELKGVKGPLGLPIERDLYFMPRTLEDLMKMHKGQN